MVLRLKANIVVKPVLHFNNFIHRKSGDAKLSHNGRS